MSVIVSELADWDSFYVIVGSAAGALIGLQFVVLTLLAQRSVPQDAAETGAVFATPTIVHLGVALLLSALLRAPWSTIDIPAAILSVIGFSGLTYIGVVALRMRRGKGYLPVPEDWLFHAVLPLAAYAVIAWSLFADHAHLQELLFGVGAAALLLLFVGIHNAWDNVAYTVFIHDAEH